MLEETQVMMVDRGALFRVCNICLNGACTGSIFSSSCSKIMEANPNNLKENLSIRFLGEAGVVRPQNMTFLIIINT